MLSIKVCPSASHKPLCSICCRGIFVNRTRLDSVFFLKASCVVLVYIPLSYWEHRHTYIFSWGLYFHYINRKQSRFREEADLLVLPISSLFGFVPLHFGGWLEHLFLLLQKLFVCLNNYTLMFLILLLKSLESHYPVSGLSRFWIFRNSIQPSVESWCTHQATVSSPLTFERSCTRGSMQPICNLPRQRACIVKRVSAGLFGSSVRAGGHGSKRGRGSNWETHALCC